MAVERPAGGRVSYLIAENPDRPRVIFAHGWPGSAAYSADYLRELSDVAEVIAIDRPGYVESADLAPVLSHAGAGRRGR